MSRQIKFRQPIIERDGKFIEWHYWGYIDGEWIDAAIHTHGKQTRQYSEQFTGLLDKNGKEICIGDILSEQWLCEVYQDDEGTFMVKFYKNPSANKPMNLKRYLFRRNNAGCGERDNVIIGNIHENPELVK